jgi:hypothetical protein
MRRCLAVLMFVWMRVFMGVITLVFMYMTVPATVGMHMIVFMLGEFALYSHFASATAAGYTHTYSPFNGHFYRFVIARSKTTWQSMTPGLPRLGLSSARRRARNDESTEVL